MDDFHRKDIVKRCQSHIDVKFPSQIHYDTCLASIDQRTPTSILREKWIQGNYAYIFKVTENAISFLGRRNATQIKTPRHWTGNDSFIYLSLVDYFFR